MSGQNTAGMSFMKFVTQDEVDETRKKRQEDWEKKRKPDDPLECPEEVIDNRSLYEKLQEQKDLQQQEFEAKHDIKNSIRGLEEDEAQFLDHVSDQKIEINKAKNREEAMLFQELKDASVTKIADTKTKPKEENKPATKPQLVSSSSKKSQQALLAGAVKRKSTENTDATKKQKTCTNGNGVTSTRTTGPQTAQVIGILPGLCAYDDNTSDSNSSSSDSDGLDFSLLSQKKITVTIDGDG